VAARPARKYPCLFMDKLSNSRPLIAKATAAVQADLGPQQTLAAQPFPRIAIRAWLKSG